MLFMRSTIIPFRNNLFTSADPELTETFYRTFFKLAKICSPVVHYFMPILELIAFLSTCFKKI